MITCPECRKLRQFLFEEIGIGSDELEEILRPAPRVTKRDIEEHNRRIVESAQEAITLPRKDETC